MSYPKSLIIEGHTLALWPGGPFVQILRASILRGSNYPESGIINLPLDAADYRLATVQDFDLYRVCYCPDWIVEGIA